MSNDASRVTAERLETLASQAYDGFTEDWDGDTYDEIAAALRELAALRASYESVRMNSERFEWCQNHPGQAQAMFWNYTSRRDRAKAIDSARAADGEKGGGGGE